MSIPEPKQKGQSFEELLIRQGLVAKDRLRDLAVRAVHERKCIELLLIESGIPENEVFAVKAAYLGYEFADVSDYPLSTELLKQMKPAYAKNYKVLPLKYEDETLTVAMVEPRDVMALDEVVRHYRGARYVLKDVKVVMTTSADLFAAIDKFYATAKPGDQKEARSPNEEIVLGNILSRVAETYKLNVELASLSQEEATENSAPMVMLANKIVEDAFRKRASDIHIEPSLSYLRVRYRIDGELMEVMRVPKYAQDALIARYKIMCDMRIDERRLPQDGRIDFTKQNPTVEVDLRVSTVPTTHGEDIVMRILDKKSAVLSLDMLGFNEHNMKLYKEAIQVPYGILLHVGPTGSGKTTALYAALKSLDVPNVKILTAEDPVEYTLGGQIIQSNVHTAAGYTFAKAIRAFMRHDPDIILIGEIRDLETAKTAVEASLTGHMVFSTLHTNDAVATITRLTEMGIEPYLVADSLVIVCAQRLVRRICTKCKESYMATDEEIEMAKGDIEPGTTLYLGKGCPSCEGIGYRGRVGIYEVLAMNRKLRNLLIKGAQTDELRTAALASGMRTLRQDAVEKALLGITTLAEVFSTTLAEV
ncbi:MAG: type IV pilus assembly protein PilB [Nitrospirae bacterium]|nr:MAG: type IV pilus assembly protein PilB [Nitrospirota bacterium]